MRNRAVRTTAVILLILILQAPIFASQVRETILPNGLKVLTKEVHVAPVVTFHVWYKVGSRNETFGKTGMSHLLEHMQFKGTKTLKRGEIDRLINANGGLNNAATWKDWTYYWETLASDKLGLAMKIESDRMVNSLLDPKEFNSEKTVVLSELEGNENDPDRLMTYELYALAFKAHPYHWPTIGWRKDVETITRDQLYKHYNTYYQPNNAVIVIVGDFDTQKALAIVKKYFGAIPKGPEPPKVTEVEPAQVGERTAVIREAGASYRVNIGYHIPAIGNPDIYALDILDKIMDSGASSRLYKALIDKQLAVSASAYGITNKNPDLFIMEAIARDGVKIEDVKSALLAEVERLKTEQVSDQELQKALNQLEADFVYANDSVTDQAEQLGYYEAIHSWRFLDKYLENARKVTKADLQKVAQKYFTDKNMSVVTFIPEVNGEQSTVNSQQSTVNSQQSTVNSERYAAYRPADSMGVSQPPIPNPQSAFAKASADKSEIRNVKPSRFALDNGMVVIIYENRSNPTVAFTGGLNAGGMLDPEGKKGLAAMTADLLQKGTSKRTADQIAQEKDFVGMSIGTGADTDSAAFSGRALSKNLDLMLELLSDSLRNPTFPQDEFDKLKVRRLSGIKQEQDDPDSLAFRAFAGKVFPAGHPYHSLTVEEDLANTSAITSDDVVSFYKSHYGPETAVLALVGDVDAQEALAKIKAHFGDWQKIGAPPRQPIPDVPRQTTVEKQVIPMPDKSQDSVILGYAGGLKRTDPDFYAATIMNYVLGGGGALGSQLGNVIRDDMGLVYTVYSTFDAGLGAGAWYAYLGTNPENVDKATKVLVDQMKLMRDKGADKQKVQEAIDFLTGSFPARRLVDNGSIAQTLYGAEVYGLGMDYIQKYSSLYRAVTPEKVNAMAKKYLHPEAYTLVIAGPYQETKQ